MSLNIQLITACALSLATGLYLGHYFTPISNQHTHIKSRKLKNNRNQSSPSNSPSDITDESFEEDDEEDASYTESLDLEESEEEDFEVDSTSLNDIPGETKMALVVRQDLKMEKGKIAAQCAHAALGCYRLMLHDNQSSQNLPMLQRWEHTGQAKITLKTQSKEDMDLLFAKAISLNINAYIVHDAGRTQIAAGSATVLGLGPAPKAILDQVTGDLKLY
ncbi:putative peptidyl-tRNA hydrolase 2 [Wickerhamomyces ciferrii]|uniref:peptidyl-tRNA hydrolase n=1 Tax=Wickerhamomyces ciferrii (strain ATCC 14091 / BCRC 22168 / CBS 111 / JCM 3599 / NBRC 0793 / NRRL Y-1031 F-60-10) TaxID=1206466 RepID=K0KQ62_WICCF|nr:putative peptidyl-tRNA hydrolase 2 [Wickerhamomyces ciferrii]CCH45186.1 putative peptidyl-tRNA hydrolase 2 [Wickerhamomyces ciferrii]